MQVSDDVGGDLEGSEEHEEEAEEDVEAPDDETLTHPAADCSETREVFEEAEMDKYSENITNRPQSTFQLG